MKVNFYLVVNATGSIKAVKNKPGLSWDEIAIKCNLALPDALFQKPSLEATVVIPDEAAMPRQIEAEVIENAKAAIEQATGLEVRLSLIKEDE